MNNKIVKMNNKIVKMNNKTAKVRLFSYLFRINYRQHINQWSCCVVILRCIKLTVGPLNKIIYVVINYRRIVC